MIDLACICGSRTFNLQTPSSDVDIVIVTNDDWAVRVENKDGFNILYNTKQLLWDRFVGNIEYVHIWQFLYPERWCSNNEVVDYIIANRDGLVKANLPYIYRSFGHYFASCAQNMSGYYMVAKKRICYGLLYASVLYNYANGVPFAQCVRPDGEWHDMLLGIRTGNVAFDHCVELVDEYATKIASVSKFYDVPTDMDKLLEFKGVIDSHDYIPYEQIKEKYGGEIIWH